jgi:hypothetical protein
MKTLAEQFFAGSLDRDRVLRDYPIDYIFFGPREKTLGQPDPAWLPVYTSGEVSIYRSPDIGGK